MAYVHFTPSVPIADNTGAQFVTSVEKNLQVLRDIGIMGIALDWDMTDDSQGVNIPSAQPTRQVWRHRHTGEAVSKDIAYYTRGSYEYPRTIAWKYIPVQGGTESTIGTETLVWAVDGNLSSSSWAGSMTTPKALFEAKPTSGDAFLTVISDTRTNLMALRDFLSAGICKNWSYSITAGGGTDYNQPSVVTRTNTAAAPDITIREVISYNSTGTVQKIVFQHQLTGSSNTMLGEKQFTYDSDSNLLSTLWTTTGASGTYPSFIDNKPSVGTTGAVVINETRQNINAVILSIMHGAPYGWNYTNFTSAFGGTAARPILEQWLKGAQYLYRVTTWGTSGNSEGCPTSYAYSYRLNAGGTLEVIGTVTFTYGFDGIVTAYTWA